MEFHLEKVVSLGIWAKTDGFEFSGIMEPPIPIGWVEKTSMICDWLIRRLRLARWPKPRIPWRLNMKLSMNNFISAFRKSLVSSFYSPQIMVYMWPLMSVFVFGSKVLSIPKARSTPYLHFATLSCCPISFKLPLAHLQMIRRWHWPCGRGERMLRAATSITSCKIRSGRNSLSFVQLRPFHSTAHAPPYTSSYRNCVFNYLCFIIIHWDFVWIR